MNKTIKAILYCLAVLLLLIAIADKYLWISITAEYETFDEMKHAYLQMFPPSIRDAGLITVIEVLLLLCSIFIFIQAVLRDYLKILSIILLSLSGLLFVWNLFSLM